MYQKTHSFNSLCSGYDFVPFLLFYIHFLWSNLGILFTSFLLKLLTENSTWQKPNLCSFISFFFVCSGEYFLHICWHIYPTRIFAYFWILSFVGCQSEAKKIIKGDISLFFMQVFVWVCSPNEKQILWWENIQVIIVRE